MDFEHNLALPVKIVEDFLESCQDMQAPYLSETQLSYPTTYTYKQVIKYAKIITFCLPLAS